ncbi:MAG TPA: hypothetical protein PKD26_16960 [Pyrinomonadaceae bacterium]|nr:hypothetical protein [Pyrinomonadaceae bacterium]
MHPLSIASTDHQTGSLQVRKGRAIFGLLVPIVSAKKHMHASSSSIRLRYAKAGAVRQGGKEQFRIKIAD